MHAFLTKLRYFFGKNQPDVNISDLDLCEWRGQTILYFNWCVSLSLSLSLSLSALSPPALHTTTSTPAPFKKNVLVLVVHNKHIRGEQHYDNALCLGVADMPLRAFLEGWFDPPSAS